MKTKYLIFVFLFLSLKLYANEISEPCENYLAKSKGAGKSANEQPELKAKMLELQKKYPDSKTRDEKSTEYLEDIEKVISLTSDGSRLLGCFKREEGEPFVKESDFQLFPSGLMQGLAATFLPDEVAKQKGKSQKVIRLSRSIQPLSAVVLVMHELQHSCRAKELLKEIEDKNPVTIPGGYQDDLVDEIRAYKVEALAFAELSAQLPEEFCKNEVKDAALFKGATLPEYKFESQIYDKIENGTFHLDVLRVYLDLGTYPDRSHFYDGEGSNELLPSVVKKIKAAGFAVDEE